MGDEKQAAPAPQAAPGQLIDIGTVAAQNIAKRLSLPAEQVGTIKTAIVDEINAMSSHFTLAVADVQNQFEIEVNRIKSEWSFVKANPVKVGVAGAIAALIGFVIGHLV